MQKLLIGAALALLALAALPSSADAQAFEKKNYNYSEWTKGVFSEAVTVVHPGKFIFLGGVGPEAEDDKGAIRYPGDFMGQCRYTYDKIKRFLAKNGATLNDAVKVVTYIVDMRYRDEAGQCRSEALAGAPQPPHTLIGVSQLASPGMLLEVDVIAATAQ
jgi:enamine deaminase RidA (YjgF/YER057c/UK114 family)